MVKFQCRRAYLSGPPCQEFFWQRIVGKFRRIASSRWPRASRVFQDEGAAVSEIDFRGFPGGAGALGTEFGRLDRGFFIVGWNPGADGLPGWFDGLEGLIRPPRLAGSPCGLRLRLRPKRLRSLGVFRCRVVVRAVAEDWWEKLPWNLCAGGHCFRAYRVSISAGRAASTASAA